jgi:hypothetical protein
MGQTTGIAIALGFGRGRLLTGSTSGYESEAVAQILGYFLRNPGAADSLEAIARWRLLEQCAHRSFQKTEAALNWLVEAGYLQEVWVSGSNRIFRLDPAKRPDAVELLKKRAGPADPIEP